MFSTLPRSNLNFSVTFILSSANAFSLDQSKNLLFGKELNCHLQILLLSNSLNIDVKESFEAKVTQYL